MPNRPVLLMDLGGPRDFGEVLALQRAWTDEVADGGPERLLLVEHDHVVTLGRGTDPANVLDRSMPVVEVERGGDATYHGPGQLVAYPLLRLAERGLGIHTYLRALEQVVVRALAGLGLRAQSVPRRTGVWVEDRKVASIGIAVRRGVSLHGLALNVTTDLSRFAAINPCGFDAAVMTRVADLLVEPVTVGNVKHAVVDAFEVVFGSVLTAPAPRVASR